MKKIIIAPKSQYGYITDYLQMVKRLAAKGLAVDVICFDEGLPKIDAPENVEILYVARTRYKLVNYSRHISAIAKRVLAERTAVKWVVISANIELSGILPGLLKLFTPNVRWILDIRTCAVFQGAMKRKVYDWLVTASAVFFDRTTIISPLVAERLGIKKFDVLPLGSDCYIDLGSKVFCRQRIEFLYVGKFDDRRVGDLVRAFDAISNQQNGEDEMVFHIVGFADREEEAQILRAEIDKADHKEQIIWHGKKSHAQIKELFETASIGFSYIPKTEFFDVQPPTKTYEYIRNGMVCIATNTRANAEIITAANGVLVNDDVPALVAGIELALARLDMYESSVIAQTVEKNEWQYIMGDFHRLLEQIEAREDGAEQTKRI
ncbi:glycosyltransferase [Planococcus sp. X10-3]|uniref:glycosyltransferase n=1 Tax=Planococcus sp. X10-3 TaxID=3061240 RepID=UPI003BAEBF09